MESTNTQSTIKQTIGLTLVLLVTLLMGILIGMQVLPIPNPHAYIGEQNADLAKYQPQKIEELIRFIEARYVDDIDRNELIDQVLQKEAALNAISDKSNEGSDQKINGKTTNALKHIR